VRAASVYAHVFEVTVDYVNISGFNVIGVTGVEKAGFYLNGRQHCNILDNIADSNRVGIDLSSSSNNTLMGNTADSNDYGIGIGNDPHPIPGGESIDHTHLTKLFLEDNFIVFDSGEGQNVSKKCIHRRYRAGYTLWRDDRSVYR